LTDRLRTLSGVAALVVIGLVWISLITWSIADPSLVRMTSAPPRNWLGVIGAHTADAGLQALGLAAFLALFAPMLWAIDRVRGQRVRAFATRLLCHVGGVIACAGSLSAIGAPRGWPLQHYGLGGAIGDGLLGAVAGLVASLVHADAARPIAGGVLLAIALVATLYAIGVRADDDWTGRTRSERRSATSRRSASTGTGSGSGIGTGPATGTLAALTGLVTGAHRSRRGDWTATGVRETGRQERAEPSLPMGPELEGPERTPSQRGPTAPYGTAEPRERALAPAPAASDPDDYWDPNFRWDDQQLADEERTSGRRPEADLMPGGDRAASAGRIDHDRDPLPPLYGANLRSARQPGQPGMTSQSGATGTGSPGYPAHPASSAYAAEPADTTFDNDTFDDETDTTIGGMAAIFAPRKNAPRALQNSLASAFGLGQRQPASDDLGSNGVGYPRGPSMALLARSSGPRPANSGFGQQLARGTARQIEAAFAEFRIEGTISAIEPGPVVTAVTFEPRGTTTATRIKALAPDIARQMGWPPLRVADVPGRSKVTIEIPNADRKPIVLRDCFDAAEFRSSTARLPIALGLSTNGERVVLDLSHWPGLLVSTGTGEARATCIDALILSLVYRHGPEGCRFLMIDPRMSELAAYQGIPHLLTPVLGDPVRAIQALRWCVRELETRATRIAELGARNIDMLNARLLLARRRGDRLPRSVQTGFDPVTHEPIHEVQEISLDPVPYIVVVIDDLSPLMAIAGSEVEQTIATLAKSARQVGIYLVVATDRASRDIATPLICSSLTTRIAYRTSRVSDDRIGLEIPGTEHLLADGDSLLVVGNAPAIRVHGPIVSPDEVAAVTASLRDIGPPVYVEGIADGPPPVFGGRTSTVRADTPRSHEDDLYDRAVAVVVREQGATAAFLQSTLRITPSQTYALLERLTADGLVADADARGIYRLRAA
jgi:S-DNA-T family DNA segregation ATPase FtsK/SpoIIIE